MPQFKTISTDKCYSDVARLGERTLCVTVPELVDCGVSEKYLIKCALPDHRNGANYCWPHHKEGNVVFIHYDGLKDKYKRLIDAVHCNSVEANIWAKNEEAQKRQKELTSLCVSLPAMLEVYPSDIAELQNTGYYEGVDVQRLARAAGWLRLWRNLNVKKAREMGFTTVVELQTALFEHCMLEQKNKVVKFAKPINTIRVLDRKAREFAKDGFRAMIGGYFGSANNGKMNPQIHAALMIMASSPLKYSFEDIAQMYNEMEQYQKYERLTTSAIKAHLNTPANKLVWFNMSHGTLAGNDKLQPLALRDRPSKPDLMWSIDGTTTQLYYRDAKGKIKSDLYVYFVTDACTGAIIGSSVAFTETTELVVEALQDAIMTHSNKPYQIQYDNGSANVNTVMTNLMNNLAHVHFPCQPYLGRAKYVESIIGHFQQRVLHKYDGFKGSNITSTSLKSKANPELLKFIEKNPERLLSQTEVLETIDKAIVQWNARGENRDNYGRWVGSSKMELYKTEYEGREKLNRFEKYSIFMIKYGTKKKPMQKYGQHGIKITISGKKYYYIVPDPDNSGYDFMFSRNNLYKSFRVRLNLNNLDNIELYNEKGVFIASAVEKEAFASCVKDMKPGEMARVRDFVQKQKENGIEYARRELYRQIMVANKAQLKATGTDGYFVPNHAEGMMDWGSKEKNAYNTIEGDIQDELNGITQTSRSNRNDILTILNGF